MLSRITWKEDTVLSVKISEDLFCLAQMRQNSLLEFFDIFKEDSDWITVDLNETPVLFGVFVAEKRLKSIFLKIPTRSNVIPNQRPPEHRMLSAVIEANQKYGADLIELGSDFSAVNARTIKQNLDMTKDRDTIYKYELTGMIGSSEKICQRLLRYVETGVNWDDSKTFLFPKMPHPRPTRVKLQ